MSRYTEDLNDTLADITRTKASLTGALGALPPALKDTYDTLITVLKGLIHNAPMKRTDRVRLSRTPVINDKEAPGWRGFKHFLVEGAVGVVEYVRFGEQGYEVFVSFDEESWIDQDGNCNPISPDSRSHFRFKSADLEVIP